MAPDGLGDSPCCSEVKKKLQKSEKGRTALRQAIKVLEGTVDRVQDEKNALQRVLDDERVRARLEQEVAAKELTGKKELEKEICYLKEEISALRKLNGLKRLNEDVEEKLRSRIRELEEEVGKLKENLGQERRRSNLANQKAESAKKLVEAEKRKGDESKKQANEEKVRADAEKKQADLERNRAEEQRSFADAAKNEVALERQKLVEERAKVEETNKKAASEKNRADKEKKRADLQMKMAQELRQSIEAEKRRCVDEKARGDNACKVLKEERKRREALEKELQQTLSSGREKRQCPHCNGTDDICGHCKRKKSPNEKLLKEKLKLKVQQLQNVERAAQEERTQKDLFQLEVSLLKQYAIQFWNRVNLLENLFSRDDDNMKGHLMKSDALGSTRCFDLKRQTPIKGSCKFRNENDRDLGHENHIMMQNLNYHGPLVEYNGIHHPVSGGSFRGTLSGTDFQLESPVGVSLRSKSQCSAVYSTTSSFSDRQLVGSQGKGDLSVLASGELCKEGLVEKSFAAKVVNGKFKGSMTGQCDMPSSIDESDAIPVNTTSQSLVPDAELEARSLDNSCLLGNKVRSPCDALKLIKRLHSKNLKNNLKIEELLTGLRGEASFKDWGPSLRSVQKFKLEGRKRLRACKSPENCGNEFVLSKKRKISTAADVFSGPKLLQHIKVGDLGVSNKSAGTEYASISNNVSPPVKKKVYSGKGKALNITCQDMLATPCFDDMIGQNFLKLLELDGPGEERYRMALEEPLSPSLPEINFSKSEGIDESICLLEKDWLNQVPETKEEISTPYEAFDVIHTESQLTNMKSSRNSVGMLPEKLAFECSQSFEASKLTGQDLVPHFDSVLPMPELDRSCSVNTSRASDTQTHDVCVVPDFNSLLCTREIDKCLSVNTFGPKASDIQTQDVGLECSNERGNPTLASFRCPIGLSEGGNENDIAEPDIVNLPIDIDYSLLFTQDVEADQACNSFSDICCLELDGSVMLNEMKQGCECEPMTESLFDGHSHFNVAPMDHNDLSVSAAADEVDTHQCESISHGGYAQEVTLDGLFSSTLLKGCMNEVLQSCDKIESKTSGYPVDGLYEAKSASSLGNTHENSPKYLVVFPGIEDEDIILKLYHALQASRRIHVPQKDCMVEKLMFFLTKMNLLDKEWASVFFSSLLCSFVLNVRADCTSNSWMEPPFYVDSLISQLKNVGDGQNCWLELLLVLIVTFVINGRVFHFVKSQHELVGDYSTTKALSLDGQEVFLSSQVASINLLVAGSTILACICSAVGRISFLLEVSYLMLRQCKKSSFWVLTVLHCFFSVCGESYFMPSSRSQVVTVMQSIVSFLEGGDKFRNHVPSSHAVFVANGDSRFPPCARCPFAKGVVCMENVTRMLFKEIQDQTVHVSMHELGTMLKYEAESGTFSYRRLGNQSHCMAASASCTLVDKFSLVELLAFYMGWDWTYNNIVPSLLELLGSSIPNESVAAVLILVGQLGRLGVDPSGHEEKGVEQLRYNLSKFLNPRDGCFLVQLAAVTALLNLLSIEFAKCIQKDTVSDVCESNYVMLVRRWFSELNNDQQSSTLCLLAADAQRKI